jgi:transposase InsO family protein
MKLEYPARLLCQVLSVSPSGYYDWQHRQTHPSGRALENAHLIKVIEQIHQASRKTYGSPRIQQALRQRGCCHGRNRIARLMRQKNLFGRRPRRFRVQTTDSNHAEPVAPNRLAQYPAPQAANQVWLADITYIPTDEGWLYLAGILDLFSRKIVGWAMAECLDTRLVLASWNMALAQRHPGCPQLLHSDRGVQYASAQFRNALRATNTLGSMSRKGNCYDNAVMESFWSTLKHELIYRCHFQTRAQARQAIFEYIEVFYNRRRLHSSLNFLSPVDFENQNN